MSYGRTSMSRYNSKDGNKQGNQSHKRKMVDDLRNRLQRPIRVKAGDQSASDRSTDFGPDRPPLRLGKLTVGRDHAVAPIQPAVPSEKPADTFHWDPILKGFGIRASATGRQVYFVQYRERGQTRRRVIGSVADLDPRTARRKARQILSAVKVGLGVVDPFNLPQPAPTMPFAVFAERFWEAHAHRWAPTTQASNRKAIDRVILPEFGKIDLAEITRAMVRKWHAAMGDRPGTANRTLPVLSVMMATAETMGLRPRRSNPCTRFTRFRTQRMERYLSLAEVGALGAALWQAENQYPQQCAIIRLLLLTGARKREIESLRWSYLDDSFAHLAEAKTGPRTVYLGRPARELLATLPRGDDDFVFPRDQAEAHAVIAYYVWDRIRISAGLADVRLHDLRHTFASHAAMMRVSQPTIAKMLGHSLFETTDRYTHLSDTSVREAVGRVSAHLARATGFVAKGDAQ
ncbi:site-specific integrase [Polymorphobacter megasporae]|uniref:site-specific integrase n=1 Tax=Glacieibacterium megasporae TaxID=2835787 RepID=UPI001C1DFDDF|nr:site-specific integrase [Polymorphobacter megasporae]UAJ12445.1 tyrosine-type recombinase/integrase [Polymorphobacter megasporae]